MNPAVIWDAALIAKYDKSGPRYTSYPTALEFSEAFDRQAFISASQQHQSRPLSLYVHIPFCHTLCYYCGCNKVITRHQDKADRYIDYLAKEIASQAPLFAGRTVTQLHWGGGTPTFLTATQIDRLVGLLKQHFTFAAQLECSIEVDPREIELSIVDVLAQHGFNRMSIGVQDFNKEVQRAVNREQDEAFIGQLIEYARARGFASINLDLIYGLPLQTLDSFAQTLDKVIALNPDRLSVFNYAHLPHRFAAQRKIKDQDLPDSNSKLAILQYSIQTLVDAGYQYIGMDHFAKPDDELAKAQREGVLHRNFQGYTTQEQCDLLGLGVSAISQMGESYAQNYKTLNEYYQHLDDSGHALQHGLELQNDDIIRRDVIKQLICNLQLYPQRIEQRYGIDFHQYFAEDLALLAPLIEDKLLISHDDHWEVSATGRLLIRNICMCFDRYLRQRQGQQFSRVI